MSSDHSSRGAAATKYHNEEWLGSETPVSVSCGVEDVCGFRLSCQRRTPSLIRDSSCGVNPALRCTNQAHSPRNTNSRSPAKICGRPKRSRVKNLPMQGRGVFYHVPGRFWQLYSGSSISGKFRYGRAQRKPDPTSERRPTTTAGAECLPI